MRAAWPPRRPSWPARSARRSGSHGHGAKSSPPVHSARQPSSTWRPGPRRSGELTAWTFTNINSGPAAIAAPYRVPNQRIEYQPAASPLSQGSYRALAATANNFARESHIDELAHRVGRDPVEYRLDHPRRREARRGVARRSRTRRVGQPPDAGRGWGIACGLEKEGRVATAAEVRIDHDGGLHGRPAW